MDKATIEYAPVLRHLHDHGPQRVGRPLAAACGKDHSALRRAVPSLLAAGVICQVGPLGDDREEGIALTDAGERALQALELASGRLQLAEGQAAALHAQIEPRPDLNPRKEFDEADLEELRQDILTNGLLQGLVVRPAPATEANPVRFWLVGGERRWRAIGAAIADGDWPEDRPIPVQIRELTDAEHRRLAFAENVQRVQLNPVELATFYRAEIEAGRTTAEIAEAANKTPEHVQQHLRILKLDDATLDQLAAGEITFRQAREAVAKPKAKADEPAAPIELVEGQRETADEPALDPTPAQQLLLVELAAKIWRDPMSKYRQGFTPIAHDAGTDHDFADLVRCGAAHIRQAANSPIEAGLVAGGPAWRWLAGEHGFAVDASRAASPEMRDEILRRVRRRTVGVDRADGPYVTPWLNTTDDQVEAEPAQPPLIEPTPAEQAAIDAAELARQAEAADDAAHQAFAAELREELRHMRRNQLRGWDQPTFKADDLAAMALEYAAAGAATKAAAVLLMLRHRFGAIGCQRPLRQAEAKRAGRELLPCG